MDRWDILQEWLAEWADETFPASTVKSRLEHLRDELEEVEEDYEDVTEWADCFILLIHSARKAGFSMDQLFTAIVKKFLVNRKRRWGEPDERGVVRHIEIKDS